jgi:quinol monooxygenase YgiN
MSEFAIFVTVSLARGRGEEFLGHALENASASRDNEPECHEFRVMTAEGNADTFHFFEAYSNAAALESHRETPHYKAFRAATDDMVAERTVLRFDLLA